MGMAVAALLPAGASIGATTVLFGVIFSIETAVFFALLIAAPTRLTRWMASSRLRRRLDMGTGVVLIGLAVPLAVEP